MKVSAKKKREPMTGSDACVCMHTALRKCCDSKITSCVYNLVHLVDVEPERFDPWRFLGQLVAARVNKGQKPEDALMDAHVEFEDKFLDSLDGDKHGGLPREATAWMYALSCAMHCFSTRDFQGMAAYLAEEE